MNTELLEYLNRGFDPQKQCACCQCNGGNRKHTYIFKYSYKARVCVACEQRFASPGDIVPWLEANAIFDKQGKLIDFKRGDKK